MDRRDLREQLAGIDGVVESESAFKDDLAFWVNGTEIAHFDGNTIEIRLTRLNVRAHAADPRVRRRARNSDWVVVAAATRHAVLVIELVTEAATAHRAAPGTTPAAPPGGADLARRRRFH